MNIFDCINSIYIHCVYANSIPTICRIIEETIVFIGILIFLYKMFTLFDFKYESDVTYKDIPSKSYMWKYETKEIPIEKKEK